MTSGALLRNGETSQPLDQLKHLWMFPLISACVVSKRDVKGMSFEWTGRWNDAGRQEYLIPST